jgi:hypothetical protein
MTKNFEKPKQKKMQGITKISTLIIVIVSINTVVGAFYIYDTQALVDLNNDLASQRAELLDAVEYDIADILQTELLRIQEIEQMLGEFWRIDAEIGYLNAVNDTVGSNITISSNEIEQLAVEALSYMERIWDTVETTYAYFWTLQNGGSDINNYTIYGEQNYLVDDVYPDFVAVCEPVIIEYATLLYPDPKLGRINTENWFNIMYVDLEIVENFGSTARDVAFSQGLNLSYLTYYSLSNNVTSYTEKAMNYQQEVSLMNTAILLLAISALIFGFLVQIDLKKLKWISLIVGIFVAVIASYMFFLALMAF